MNKYLRAKFIKWSGIDKLAMSLDQQRKRIDYQAERIGKEIDRLEKLTREDVDIGLRGPCTLILTGVYRGKGYVKFYEMSVSDFMYHVDMYRDMRKHNLLRNVDAPYQMSGAFKL